MAVSIIDKTKFLTDGESILPVLRGEENDLAERSIFWYIPVYLNSYNLSRYERDGLTDRIKLDNQGRIIQDSTIESHPSERYPAWRTTPVNAVRKGNYKLIEFFERDQLELYNLKEDIGESRNLAEEMPQKVEELYQLITQWRNKTGAPYPLPANEAYSNNF